MYMTTTKTTKTATPQAAPVQDHINLSAISAVSKNFPQSPVHIVADLTRTTEHYIRIIRTLWEIRAVYKAALEHTYYTDEKVEERLGTISPLFIHLRDEIANDMGISIAENLCECSNEI